MAVQSSSPVLRITVNDLTRTSLLKNKSFWVIFCIFWFFFSLLFILFFPSFTCYPFISFTWTLKWSARCWLVTPLAIGLSCEFRRLLLCLPLSSAETQRLRALCWATGVTPNEEVVEERGRLRNLVEQAVRLSQVAGGRNSHKAEIVGGHGRGWSRPMGRCRAW